MIPEVTLKIPSTVPHISQIITGFHILAQKGYINLTIQDCRHELDKVPHYMVVEAIIDGLRVAFDVEDGYNYDFDRYNDYLRTGIVRIYKRSFNREYNNMFAPDVRDKISPLGMNYHVTYPGNPLDKMRYISIGGQILIANYIKHLIKRFVGVYTSLNVNNFEPIADISNEQASIIFFTRLWDPTTNETERGFKECEYINKMRIDIVRHLRKKYPHSFVGGIEDSEYAQQCAPDLILPKKITTKRNYLQIMKKSDICVGSMGLWESTGWKTAEYVAAGKAIVCERLHYENPGNFCNGVNYLSFNSAEECICKIDLLMANPQMVKDIKHNNTSYYNKYLRPDMLIKNAISQVVNLQE